MTVPTTLPSVVQYLAASIRKQVAVPLVESQRAGRLVLVDRVLRYVEVFHRRERCVVETLAWPEVNRRTGNVELERHLSLRRDACRRIRVDGRQEDTASLDAPVDEGQAHVTLLRHLTAFEVAERELRISQQLVVGLRMRGGAK
jgi:hypothetical protein